LIEAIILFAARDHLIVNSQKIEEVVARLKSICNPGQSASKSRQVELYYEREPLAAPAAPAYRRASVAARPVVHAVQEVIAQLRAPFERHDLFVWRLTRTARALARPPCRADIGQLV